MLFKNIFLFLLGLILLSTVSAFSQTISTFTDGTHSGNLSVYGQCIMGEGFPPCVYTAEKQFYVPSFVYVTNFTLRLATFPSKCGQEFWNISSCGASGIGTVAYTNDAFQFPDLLWDGNWSTYTPTGVGASTVDINYSIPTGAFQANWTIKDFSGTYVYSINQTNITGSGAGLKFKIESYGGGTPKVDAYFCLGTACNLDDLIFSHGSGNSIYEENITWSIHDQMPHNFSIGGNRILNLTTMGSVNISNATIINDILTGGCTCSDCLIDGDNCKFNLTTFTPENPAGFQTNITYDDLIINYTVSLDICAAGQQAVANFTIFDENNLTKLNASIAGAVEFTAGTLNFNSSFNFTNTANFSLCIFPNYSAITADFYIQYVAAGGITERFFLDNALFTNHTKNYYLYNFADTAGLSQLKANLNTYYLAYYPGVIAKLQRYYPASNVWLTVQMDRSDDFGRAIFYVYQNYVDYRFIWEKDNVQIVTLGNGASTNPLKFICASATSCEETFVIDTETMAEYTGMTHALTYNNYTGIILLSWSDTLSEVQNVRLLVQQQAANRIISICDTTVSSAAGATSCNISSYTGVITARAFRSASPFSSFASLTITKIYNQLKDILHTTGHTEDGVLLSFFVMLGIASLGGISAALSVVFGSVALIFMWMFGLVGFVSLSFVIGGVALALLLAYVMNR